MEIEPCRVRRAVRGLTETYWFKVYNPRIGQYVYFRSLEEAIDWIYSISL